MKLALPPASVVRRPLVSRGFLIGFLFMLVACAPWQATGTGRAIGEGTWEAGAGFSWLAPQSFRIWQGLPAPQIWIARGISSDADVRVIYAPPFSLDARIKWQVRDGRNNAVALHAGAGWISYGGVLDVPLSGLPYGTFGATMSRHPTRALEPGADGAGQGAEEGETVRVPFATLGAMIPFVRHERDRTAVAVWITGNAGVEWQSDDLWIAPQLGWIVPVGQWNRWIWAPGVAAGARR